MRRRILLALSVIAISCAAITVLGQSGSAAKVPNFGYPVAGARCAVANALAVNTPVAVRYARVACLPGQSGVLTWQREPTEQGRCSAEGSVWGIYACTGGRWSSAAKTFCCSMSDALIELKRVLGLVNASSSDDPAAPSGSTFLENQYVRSPVDEELRDRLATAGIQLSMKSSVYVLTSGAEMNCVRWVDPWPSGHSGDRPARPDAVKTVPCPTSDISKIYSQLEAIALEAGALYHSDKNAYLARVQEFADRIEATGYAGQFLINHTRSSDPENVTPLFAELTFTVTDSFNCMKYVHNNGSPYLDLTIPKFLCE